MFRRRSAAALLVGLLTLTAMGAARPAQAAERRVDVLIQFHSAPTIEDIGALRRLGAHVTRRFEIVPAVAATVSESAMSALTRNPRVAVVELDSTLVALEYRDGYDWGIGHIGADDVHRGGNVGAGIRVAIIDSGIDCDHLELVAHCEHGWNYVTGTQNADDDYGHGTHVAGSVAASLHGTVGGVVGAAPGATVVAYKTLDSGGIGAWSRHIAAIDDIWNGGQPSADIVNMSIGRGDYSSTAEMAMQRAYEAGMLLVAAAGNSGTCAGKGSNVSYPASFSSVVAVAAVDAANQRPCWSSTGDQVELTAPGVSVFSTWPSDMATSYRDPQPVCQHGDADGDLDCHYKFGSGTSMSTPHIAGVAALVLSSGSIADADGRFGVANEVRARLAATAVDLGSAARDPLYGHGLVDAFAAAAGGGGGGEPPAGHITLTASGFKVRGVQHADLRWSGATTADVDVYRDGALVASTRNDGGFTDNLGRKGGGSYVYRICEADSVACSTEVSVSF